MDYHLKFVILFMLDIDFEISFSLLQGHVGYR